MKRKKKYSTAASARPLDDFEFDRLEALLQDYVVSHSPVILGRVAEILESTGRDPAPYISDLRREWRGVRHPAPPFDEGEAELRRLIVHYSYLAL